MPAWCLPVGLLLLLGMIWGSITNLARFVGQHSEITPLEYACWTTFLGGLLLLVINLARGRRVRLSRRHLWFYLGAGVIGSAVPTANMFWVLGHISAGRMSIALATVPLFTYAIAMAIRSEPFNGRRGLGVFLGFLGAMVVVIFREPVVEDATRLWFVLAFLTPLCYATGNHVVERFRPPTGDSLTNANGMLLAAGIALFIVSMVVNSNPGLYPIWQESRLILGLILVHGALSGAAFGCFFLLIRIAGVVYFSQTAYLVMVFGIGIGMIVFGERHGLSLWVAAFIIFLGVLLVNLTQSKRDA